MMKTFLALFLLIFLKLPLYANNYYCFETHNKLGKVEEPAEILLTKLSAYSYEITAPANPESNISQIFQISNEDEEFLLLEWDGIINSFAHSFNIIIDKIDLKFSNSSFFSPLSYEKMELGYGYCRKL